MKKGELMGLKISLFFAPEEEEPLEEERRLEEGETIEKIA